MRRLLVGAALCLCGTSAPAAPPPDDGGDDGRDAAEAIVARVVRPLMQREAIPGMAVGIVSGGTTRVFTYGVASRTTGKAIDEATLFEIGSVSKTFTATLAAYADVTGKLSLDDRVGDDLPALHGSAFDTVRLLDLGTHTAGGLPLQLPSSVTDDAALREYFRQWRPSYAPGTVRVYGNPGIGLLGQVAATRLGDPFVVLMQRRLFPAFGLDATWLDVPAARMGDYAEGHTTRDVPIRLQPGPLSAEAYGVRTTARDLLRFVEINLATRAVAPDWRRAIELTHIGRYRVGPMTQALVWERYGYPVTLADLVAGNSPQMAQAPQPATAIVQPEPPAGDVLFDKTGSTNGFSTYVVFVPSRQLGIVLLANRNFPIERRVAAAYELLAGFAARESR